MKFFLLSSLQKKKKKIKISLGFFPLYGWDYIIGI